MVALLAQLLAIAAAPLASRAMEGRPRATTFVDATIQVVVAGTLLLHVLPEGLEAAGVPALAALILGFTAGLSSHRIPGGRLSAEGVAVLALAVHGLVDGAALGVPGNTEMAWAVVLHTVPVSLAVWRLAVREQGPRLGMALLGVTAAATALGFAASATLTQRASVVGLGLVQCALAGVLLHVVGHLSQRPTRPWDGVGGVAGLLLLAAVPTHEEHRDAALVTFRMLALAGPWLLAAWGVVGVLHALVPASPTTLISARSPLGSAARGAVVGLPLPLSSCGTLPVYRTLVSTGTTPSGALAFLVAGAGVGVSAIAISVPLLGPRLTLARVAAAAALGLVVGGVVGVGMRPVSGRAPLPRPRASVGRLGEALRYGFVETVDHMGPWLVTGLVVGGLAAVSLPADAFTGLPEPLVVVFAAAAGLPSWVCATGATPLVAVLLGKGLGPGAALAFLLTGPAANASAFGLLRRLHGSRVATRFAALVTTGAVAAGLLVDRWPPTGAPPLEPGPLGYAAAVVIAGLLAVSFVRRGPAGFAEPLLHPHHDHEPPEDHPFVRLPPRGSGPMLTLRDPR
ncbi:MAG: permease [Myxococcales bacterium]|nr:permease [Myxococcales bacterium]